MTDVFATYSPTYAYQVLDSVENGSLRMSTCDGILGSA